MSRTQSQPHSPADHRREAAGRQRPLLRRLHAFSRRPWADKWLLLRVFVLLGLARLAIDLFSFARLERLLGPRMSESPLAAPVEHLREARRVAWAVRKVSRYTPWNSNCFPQAITAKLLLRRQGIPSTLYIGAAFKEDASALEGHAWLRCGPLYVVGGNGHGRFGAVATYGE